MGKFWQANDYLFEHGRESEPITVQLLAQNLGLDLQQLQVCIDAAGAEMVKADIEEGLGLKVQGTPTFVVGDKLYAGRIPDEVLEEFQR
jgi:protein-disulfide isomerase